MKSIKVETILTRHVTEHSSVEIKAELHCEGKIVRCKQTSNLNEFGFCLMAGFHALGEAVGFNLSQTENERLAEAEYFKPQQEGK